MSVSEEKIEEYGRKVQKLRDEIHKGLIGQEKVADSIIKSLICNSHALLESVPGLGKTFLVRIISKAVGGSFTRIQFTPDLLPSDVTGSETYREEKGFEIQRGPIFSNFVLADEINRSPPKVQTSLLEATEEREATIGRETYPLPKPFFVLATQNPLEQQGTFPLSIAQRDRFLFKIIVDYPKKDEEFQIIEKNVETSSLEEMEIEKCMDANEFLEIYDTVKKIEISQDLKDYIMDLIEATRNPSEYGLEEVGNHLKYGVSPRASIFIPLASRATALMDGRNYVTVDDVRDVLPPVLRHRLLLSYEAEAEGVKPIDIVNTLLDEISVT